MTATINSQKYNISDGIDIGTGNLTVKGLDFSPNQENLDIKIENGI